MNTALKSGAEVRACFWCPRRAGYGVRAGALFVRKVKPGNRCLAGCCAERGSSLERRVLGPVDQAVSERDPPSVHHLPPRGRIWSAPGDGVRPCEAVRGLAVRASTGIGCWTGVRVLTGVRVGRCAAGGRGVNGVVIAARVFGS